MTAHHETEEDRDEANRAEEHMNQILANKRFVDRVKDIARRLCAAEGVRAKNALEIELLEVCGLPAYSGSSSSTGENESLHDGWWSVTANVNGDRIDIRLAIFKGRIIAATRKHRTNSDRYVLPNAVGWNAKEWLEGMNKANEFECKELE